MDAEWKAYVGGGCLAATVGAGVLGAAAAVVVPQLIPARKSGYFPAEAIRNLKAIDAAQTLFRDGDRERDSVLDYGTLVELSDAALVDSAVGSGVKSGYRFEVRGSPEEPGGRWMAVANPVDRAWGFPSYATNHDGGVFASPRRLVCNDACRIPPCCRPVGK